MMICCRGICAPQQSTGGASGGSGPITWPGRGVDATSLRTKIPPSATKGPTVGGSGDLY